MPTRLTAEDSAKVRECKDLYMEQRKLNNGSRGAIELVSKLTQVDTDKLIRWAVTDGWEEDFDRLATVEQFTDERLRPEHQLSILIDQARDAGELLAREVERMKELKDETLAMSDVQKLKLLQDATFKALDAVDKKAIEVQRRSLEIRLAPDQKSEFDTLVAKLREEYEGRGPQYEMLIEGAARVHVYLQQMFKSGRSFTQNEFGELSRLHMNYIERLQHYTEATKTELWQAHINIAVVAVMEIFERQFKELAPETWDETVRMVARATGAIMTGEVTASGAMVRA